KETPQTQSTSPGAPSPAAANANTQQGSTGMGTPSAIPQADRTSPKAVEALYREVRHELVMLPNLSLWDNLAYKVDGRKVTLLGQVRNAGLKSEAENAVKRIEG